MRNLLVILEDLWVAVAFAEAGIYEPIKKHDQQPSYQDAVHVHAV